MFTFIRDYKARKELKVTFKEKSNNLIRLRFDCYYAQGKWNEAQPILVKLKDRYAELKKDLDAETIKGGKGNKTKEKILAIESEMKMIKTRGSELEKVKNELDETKQIIPLSEGMIEDIKRCIKQPEYIYETEFLEERTNDKE